MVILLINIKLIIWKHLQVFNGVFIKSKTPLFQRNSSIQINEKSSSKHTITPCQQDGKCSPNIFNNHVIVNKIKTSKESKDTDSQVTLDDNKYPVQEKIFTLNESTEITSSVSNIDGINHNGIGVNYEKDYSDEIKIVVIILLIVMLINLH